MRYRHSPLPQAGFSLVEIMVALVIGLLTTLVIMQVFTVFEGQKRSTTGTADAQTNGSVALYTIGRDLQMAGFGLLPVTASPLECTPPPTIDTGAYTDPVSTTTVRTDLPLSPVIITDGGAASDTISIVYGTNTMAGVPTVISAVVGTTATVPNNLGCQACDIALVVNGPNCTATTVIGPTAAATTCPNATPPALSTTTTLVLQDVVGIAAGANLACLGRWNRIEYGVINGNLVLDPSVAATPIMAGIVNIQAQYGISSSANSNQIEAWVNADAAPWNVTPLAIVARNRIKAVRLAIVARNGLYERDEVTQNAGCDADPSVWQCAWAGIESPPAAIASPAPAIDLSADPDWKHYRYRVFETIIPLRNVIWSRGSL